VITCASCWHEPERTMTPAPQADQWAWRVDPSTWARAGHHGLVEISSLVPIGAAVIGAFALLLAGDLLTAKARLRRKLDRELSIADKLPAGLVRRNMDTLVRRHALELFHRERFEVAGLLSAVSAIAVTCVALAASEWVYLARHSEDAVNPSIIFMDNLFIVIFGCGLVVGLAVDGGCDGGCAVGAEATGGLRVER
jgi:hypothetical protein